MTHDVLIGRLVADLKSVRSRRIGAEVAVVAAVCILELGLFFAAGAAKPDMSAMIRQPTFWWRLLSLGLISTASGGLAIRSLDPARAPKRDLFWVALLATTCLVFGLGIGIGADRLSTILRRLDWTDGVQCAGKIIALSVPPFISLAVLMRRGAPTHMRATALLAGLAAAAWGALVFLFACPFYDPLYIAVWYSVGCGIVTLVASAVLPRLARW